MTDGPKTFAELLDLEAHGPDTWVGLTPASRLARVYGGQVVAQALWAAIQSVEDQYLPHSLHAYFIRGGDPREPIRYEVNRLRNGRSFCTRAVVARQSGGAILHLSVSFQIDETGIEAEIQTVKMPLAPNPDEMPKPDDHWTDIMERRPMMLYAGAGMSMGWVRITDEIGDDPLKHVCALAYTSDTFQFGSARSAHPAHVPVEKHQQFFIGASLDHAMWFHRPLRADAWHLYDWECRTMRGGRGATFGNLFGRDGTHVASIAQEVLLRKRRQDK